MSSIKNFVQQVGRTRIAQCVSVTPNAVTNALARGKFPSHWYFDLQALAAETGEACPKEWFAFQKKSHGKRGGAKTSVQARRPEKVNGGAAA
jgi:hypothetical protein